VVRPGRAVAASLALLALATIGAGCSDDDHDRPPRGGAVSFAQRVEFDTAAFPIAAAAGDLDGDGRTDLAVADAGLGGAVSVLINRHAAGAPFTVTSLGPRVDFEPGGVSLASSIAIGDVNGDGKQDVVVAAEDHDLIAVLVNQHPLGTTFGASSLAARVDFATDLDPEGVALGDVNGDGRLDIVTANSATTTGLTVMINQHAPGTPFGASSFAPFVRFDTGAFPQGVAVGDVNGDGKLDVVVVENGASGIGVFINTHPLGMTFTASSLAPRVPFSTGASSAPRTAQIGDLNGDFRPDIAVASADTNAVTVLVNEHALGATFTAASLAPSLDFPTDPGPFTVWLADLNGDGKRDIVTANRFGESATVLLNVHAPGASFTPASLLAQAGIATGTGSAAEFAIAADVSLDGKPDLIVGNADGDDVSVFVQN
jgi:hypothetical protein